MGSTRTCEYVCSSSRSCPWRRRAPPTRLGQARASSAAVTLSPPAPRTDLDGPDVQVFLVNTATVTNDLTRDAPEVTRAWGFHPSSRASNRNLGRPSAWQDEMTQRLPKLATSPQSLVVGCLLVVGLLLLQMRSFSRNVYANKRSPKNASLCGRQTFPRGESPEVKLLESLSPPALDDEELWVIEGS